MASEPIYGKGIVVASGFDLSAKSPLDTRSVVNTLAERDEHVANNRAYAGMAVYVLEENKEYRYDGKEWIEMLNDLSDVHAHENKDVLDGITLEKVSMWDAKSDFSGSYWDLSDLPTIPAYVSDLINDVPYASEAYVLNKIAEAELNDKEVDLSGYATLDDLALYATKVDLSSYVSKTDLQTYDYADKGFVEGLIANHDHNIISEDVINDLLKEF